MFKNIFSFKLNSKKNINIIIDKKGKIISWNSFFEKKYNKKKDEVIGKNIWDLNEVLKNNSEENKYKQLVENINEVIFSLNEKGEFTYVSPNVEKVLGYKPFEIINTAFHNYIHPDDLPSLEESFNNTKKGIYQAYEFRGKNKSGNYMYVTTTSKLILKNNKFDKVNGLLTNIHEKKLAEISMLESELKFRMLFEHANDAIILIKGLKIIDCNSKTQEYFGLSKSEILGKKLEEFSPKFQEDGELSKYKAIEQIRKAEKGEPQFFEWLHKKDDGTVFPCTIKLNVFNIEKQKYIHAIVRDNTEQKHNEEILKNAKESAEKSDKLKSAFLANMSHEIRTPLNAIIGFGQFIINNKINPNQKDEYTSIINENSDRLIKIIDDVLLLSKIESGNLIIKNKVCNINDFVRDLYESYKTSSNIRNNYNVKFVLKDYPKEIDTYTDPKRLKQILDNLISNAIKFTDKGTIEIGYSLKDKNIEFFIKDTGIGIPSDNLNSIFMPFRKVNEKVFSASNIGTGLGLSISKNLIEMLGGKIWLETEENEGSTFSFMLPYTKK